MKTKIVPIGNSKGVRIPRTMLVMCRIGNMVDMDIKNGVICIRPMEKRVRAGWEKAFETMRENGDDKLLVSGSTDFETENWEW